MWRVLTAGAFFFFQAEDGIRDVAVTGVQTCALPISALAALARWGRQALPTRPFGHDAHAKAPIPLEQGPVAVLLVREVERLMRPDRLGAEGKARAGEPALQPLQLTCERLTMALRVCVAFAYCG